MLVQRHRPMHLVNREGRTRGLVRCEGWPRDLRHEFRCRDIGPGSSSTLKVDPVAWSVVKIDLETSYIRSIQRHRPRQLETQYLDLIMNTTTYQSCAITPTGYENGNRFYQLGKQGNRIMSSFYHFAY